MVVVVIVVVIVAVAVVVIVVVVVVVLSALMDSLAVLKSGEEGREREDISTELPAKRCMIWQMSCEDA